MIQLSKIKPNLNNPRLIKDDKFKKLVQSLKDFPKMMELRPIVVDENNFVQGGNMRLKALIELGYKEIPDTWIKEAKDFTENELNEFIIKDNVGFGEWDWNMLSNDWDITQLTEWGLDIPNSESTEPDADEDYFEPGENIQTDIVEGDIIEIGEHRLICGNAMDSGIILSLMQGKKADMIFTDPPYEIDFDYANTLMVCNNANVFVFNNDRALVRQLSNSPLEFKKFFVFAHDGCAIPQEGGNEVFLTHILLSHETIGKPMRYAKGEGLRTIIKGEYRRSKHHKHEKPQSLLSDIVKSYSKKGDLIVDFFAGGGNLLLTCLQMERVLYMCELEPKNCQIIINRAKKFNEKIIIKINGIIN